MADRCCMLTIYVIVCLLGKAFYQVSYMSIPSLFQKPKESNQQTPKGITKTTKEIKLPRLP